MGLTKVFTITVSRTQIGYVLLGACKYSKKVYSVVSASVIFNIFYKLQSTKCNISNDLDSKNAS